MLRLGFPLALALSGCVAANGAISALSGSSWRLTALDGRTMIRDGGTMSFDGNAMSASAGCNRMGGPYRVESGRLIAGPLHQTEMYCEGEVMTHEQALSALLAGAPKLTVAANRLSLVSQGHKAELQRLR